MGVVDAVYINKHINMGVIVRLRTTKCTYICVW